MSNLNLKEGNLIINLPDKDAPIYRVIDFNYLIDLFKNRKLVLLRPSKWDDPFENFLLKMQIRDKKTDEEIGIRGVLDIFFGQCWSDNPEETDATWRIYSPNSNGVRISTTISRLFNAVCDAPDRASSTNVFLGKVKYMTVNQILEVFQNPDNATAVVLSADGRAAADYLLIKRMEFTHESEVRLLVRDPFSTVPQYEPRCTISVDPCHLIQEIVFDPRIPDYRVQVYQDQLAMLGVNVPVHQSELYTLPKMNIEIDVPV